MTRISAASKVVYVKKDLAKGEVTSYPSWTHARAAIGVPFFNRRGPDVQRTSNGIWFSTCKGLLEAKTELTHGELIRYSKLRVSIRDKVTDEWVVRGVFDTLTELAESDLITTTQSALGQRLKVKGSHVYDNMIIDAIYEGTIIDFSPVPKQTKQAGVEYWVRSLITGKVIHSRTKMDIIRNTQIPRIESLTAAIKRYGGLCPPFHCVTTTEQIETNEWCPLVELLAYANFSLLNEHGVVLIPNQPWVSFRQACGGMFYTTWRAGIDGKVFFIRERQKYDSRQRVQLELGGVLFYTKDYKTLLRVNDDKPLHDI